MSDPIQQIQDRLAFAMINLNAAREQLDKHPDSALAQTWRDQAEREAEHAITQSEEWTADDE